MYGPDRTGPEAPTKCAFKFPHSPKARRPESQSRLRISTRVQTGMAENPRFFEGMDAVQKPEQNLKASSWGRGAWPP